MATSPTTPSAAYAAAATDYHTHLQPLAQAVMDALRERMRADDDWRAYGGHGTAEHLELADADYQTACTALAEHRARFLAAADTALAAGVELSPDDELEIAMVREIVYGVRS